MFRPGLGQVWVRFCVFKGKTGVNGGEGMELTAKIIY